MEFLRTERFEAVSEAAEDTEVKLGLEPNLNNFLMD